MSVLKESRSRERSSSPWRKAEMPEGVEPRLHRVVGGAQRLVRGEEHEGPSARGLEEAGHGRLEPGLESGCVGEGRVVGGPEEGVALEGEGRGVDGATGRSPGAGGRTAHAALPEVEGPAHGEGGRDADHRAVGLEDGLVHEAARCRAAWRRGRRSASLERAARALSSTRFAVLVEGAEPAAGGPGIHEPLEGDPRLVDDGILRGLVREALDLVAAACAHGDGRRAAAALLSAAGVSQEQSGRFAPTLAELGLADGGWPLWPAETGPDGSGTAPRRRPAGRWRWPGATPGSARR